MTVDSWIDTLIINSYIFEIICTISEADAIAQFVKFNMQKIFEILNLFRNIF